MGRPRKRRMVEDYEKLLADGFGTGEKERYRLWIRILDFASHGVSAAIPGITVRLGRSLPDLVTIVSELE